MMRDALERSPVRRDAPSKGAEAAAVLVTGVGGIVGQQVLKSLETSRRRLVGVDMSECAAGLYAADRGYLVPPARHPGYVDRLLEIAEKEGARYLFPGLDMELPILARAADRFRAAGIVPIVGPADLVELADDKLETARFLDRHGFPALRTVDLASGEPGELPFPLVLKPRRGGSRAVGVHVVDDAEELKYRLARIDRSNYVAQEHVAGDEYTCGTITFNGRCYGAIVMRRTLRDGDTHKAFVVRDPGIESMVRNAAELLRPFGPCNFQLRMSGGKPWIFDINPRCSGTTYCRARAGFNEPVMTLDFLERGVEPSFEIRPVSFFRYWEERVVENHRVEDARVTGRVRRTETRL